MASGITRLESRCRYAILRFDAPSLVPLSGFLNSRAWSYAYTFVAPAPETTLFGFDAHADSSGSYSYRVVLMPASTLIIESRSRTQSLGAIASLTASQWPTTAPSESSYLRVSMSKSPTSWVRSATQASPTSTASRVYANSASAAVALTGLPASNVTTATVRVLRRMLLLLLGVDSTKVRGFLT